MLKNAIFHIGMPKTGTSIIQSHLAQNRPALRDNGFLYPITISTHQHLYRTYESHHLLTYSWAGWEPFNLFDPAWFFERANETADRHKLHTLLLSAENTHWLPYQLSGAKKIEAADYWERKRRYLETMGADLAPYATKIVIYLRRQDRWIESWYNQQVKNGHTFGRDMDRFADHFEYLIDYEKQLELWGNAFGRENVVVKVYEKEQLPQGLFSDFCRVAGIGSAEAYPLKVKARYNAQLSRDALEFMEVCNKLVLSADQKRQLRLLIRRVTNQFESQAVFQSQSLLSPDQRRKILDRYAPMNERIAQAYLGSEDRRLFKENEAVEEGWSPYPGLSPDTLTQLVMQVVMETAEQDFRRQGLLERCKQQRDMLRKSLEAKFPALAKSYRRRLDNNYWNQHLWDHG
jgi:hypothetical protein